MGNSDKGRACPLCLPTRTSGWGSGRALGRHFWSLLCSSIFGMGTARSGQDMLPITSPSGTWEWFREEQVVGVLDKTGSLCYLDISTLQVTLSLFLAPMWPQLGELITSCKGLGGRREPENHWSLHCQPTPRSSLGAWASLVSFLLQ